jgi:hypothetical protein
MTRTEQANTPTDAANAPGVVTNNPGPQAEQVQADLHGGYQVKQDVDGPLMWGGVGAFAPGAYVPADHPGVEQWKASGALEPYVDPFTGKANRAKSS